MQSPQISGERIVVLVEVVGTDVVDVDVEEGADVDVVVVTVVLVDVLVVVVGGAMSSNAPMSQRPPAGWGRAVPIWSVASHASGVRRSHGSCGLRVARALP